MIALYCTEGRLLHIAQNSARGVPLGRQWVESFPLIRYWLVVSLLRSYHGHNLMASAIWVGGMIYAARRNKTTAWPISTAVVKTSENRGKQLCEQLGLRRISLKTDQLLWNKRQQDCSHIWQGAWTFLLPFNGFWKTLATYINIKCKEVNSYKCTIWQLVCCSLIWITSESRIKYWA